MKLNISDPKTSKTYSVEVDEKQQISLIDKKIKDEIDLSFISKDMKGVITGGADKQGFPLVSFLDMKGRKKILASNRPGFKPLRKGQRKRKTVAGKYINENTQLVNVKLTSGDAKILEEKHVAKEKK